MASLLGPFDSFYLAPSRNVCGARRETINLLGCGKRMILTARQYPPEKVLYRILGIPVPNSWSNALVLGPGTSNVSLTSHVKGPGLASRYIVPFRVSPANTNFK